MTIVSATFQDPEVAATVADSAVAKLQNTSLITVHVKHKKTATIWKNSAKNAKKNITKHRKHTQTLWMQIAMLYCNARKQKELAYKMT